MMRGAVAIIVLAIATPASAERLFFSEHRSMSVVSHRFEGDRVIVDLHGGGVMTFDRSLISHVAPDEAGDRAESTEFILAGDDSTTAGLLIETTSYDPIIERASRAHGVSVRLVKAVIQVESGYRPRARSPRGAMGLMQLMPATAREYRARNLYDPSSNIDVGTRHLRTLLAKFELPLALAAYNAGEAAVRRFGGIPPYAETQVYVARILELLGGVPYR